MNRFLVLLMVGIHLICLGLLWLSCYPGAVFEYATIFIFFLCVFFYVFPVAILIVIVSLVVGIFVWKRQQQLPTRERSPYQQSRLYFQRLAIATSRMLFITAFVLQTNLLQYTAFALSLPAFTKFDAYCNGGCQVGFYRIEDIYFDRQGGVYFQTSSAFFRTYGFVYRPHPPWNRGLPQQSYKYHPFMGEWKWFEENHDWN